MSFSFAQFLLNQTKQCNGHLQAEAKGISVEEGLEICRELEELTDKRSCFTLQLWTCGGFTLYQMDFWKQGVHPLGHIDRIILSVDQ